MTRVTEFYGMSYNELLELPLRVFTLYNTNINRIRAEKEMRQLRVLAASDNGEMFKETYASLQEEMGEIYHKEGNSFVPMEQGAIEKLMGMQNGKTSS